MTQHGERGTSTGGSSRRAISALLDEPLTALFCSNRCPGDLILKTYDLARAMRDAGVPVIGGFQMPMERECLRLLLRGASSPSSCAQPAASTTCASLRDWRPALDDGRLLVLSPFPTTYSAHDRWSLATQRSDLVAGLAERVLIAHAAARKQDGGLRPQGH